MDLWEKLESTSTQTKFLCWELTNYNDQNNAVALPWHLQGGQVCGNARWASHWNGIVEHLKEVGLVKTEAASTAESIQCNGNKVWPSIHCWSTQQLSEVSLWGHWIWDDPWGLGHASFSRKPKYQQNMFMLMVIQSHRERKLKFMVSTLWKLVPLF